MLSRKRERQREEIKYSFFEDTLEIQSARFMIIEKRA
jgi:hypothetical protein